MVHVLEMTSVPWILNFGDGTGKLGNRRGKARRRFIFGLRGAFHCSYLLCCHEWTFRELLGATRKNEIETLRERRVRRNGIEGTVRSAAGRAAASRFHEFSAAVSRQTLSSGISPPLPPWCVSPSILDFAPDVIDNLIMSLLIRSSNCQSGRRRKAAAVRLPQFRPRARWLD
jgi:hypothetical protein